MSALERAARALAKEEYPEQPQEWHDDCWRSWEGQARAVIEAIREPSDAVYQAGFDAEAVTNPDKTKPHHVVPAIWAAMINRLLRD